MVLYFLRHDARQFHAEIAPALAGAWRRRSFTPCQTLCASLLPAAEAFGRQYHLGTGEFLLEAVARDLRFDRTLWAALAGEILWFGAEQVPEITTALATLCRLIDARVNEADATENRTPMQQVHLGTRDLVFGGAFYRPGFAGFNDVADVVRLAEFLSRVDPSRWDAGALGEFDDPDERADELEYAQECFAALAMLYKEVAAAGQVLVCEEI
jgi:hypothetical protein